MFISEVKKMSEEKETALQRTENKEHKRHHRLRNFCIFLIIMLGIWYFNNYTIKINEVRLTSDKIRNPVRIAVISDLHAHHLSISNSRIVSKIEKSEPDIVVMLGDMYTWGSSDDKIKIAVDLAGDIVDSGYPLYFVSGEHDNDRQYIKDIESAGAHVMNYQEEITDINGTSFQILGIDNVYYSPTFDLRNEFRLRSDCYSILLAHIPNFDAFASFGADLTLCADTHGGMIQLPFDMGPIYSNAYNMWFPQMKTDDVIYDKGLFPYDGGNMFITSGLGDNPAPVRLNNRPEVAVIEIDPE